MDRKLITPKKELLKAEASTTPVHTDVKGSDDKTVDLKAPEPPAPAQSQQRPAKRRFSRDGAARQSMSQRAGLTFSVARVRNGLKTRAMRTKRVDVSSAVYLTGVLGKSLGGRAEKRDRVRVGTDCSCNWAHPGPDGSCHLDVDPRLRPGRFLRP